MSGVIIEQSSFRLLCFSGVSKFSNTPGNAHNAFASPKVWLTLSTQYKE
ncbi:hypothetical protein LRHMDP2_392 [Lacticaseibacillus rhamnosus LRHMDP2]|uniref:Uncharacterized protein n=1 Tax=Lacticaseibacillus rhamnosus LRHMDP3 TaxID=1203259 RepID=A0AB33XVL0_LACRH|nr:hypothetical protein LRHMDP3_861 [Lacticaseibacillus rhamnosus LRHMDP3]EKS54151.1 hypothetical protein LRHMDP2_392 [Lacticaseibacillus rhamnosus LRHMDP2]